MHSNSSVITSLGKLKSVISVTKIVFDSASVISSVGRESVCEATALICSVGSNLTAIYFCFVNLEKHMQQHFNMPFYFSGRNLPFV